MPDLSVSPRWPSALVTDFFRARRFDGGKYGEGPVCNRAFLFFGLAISKTCKSGAFVLRAVDAAVSVLVMIGLVAGRHSGGFGWTSLMGIRNSEATVSMTPFVPMVR